MAKIDKKSIILKCVISEYIKTTAPVGSEHLQSVIGFEISSATIRNYFKQMVEEGILVQFHISGGRVPSSHALKQFWSERLASISTVTIQKPNLLEEASREYKIASIVRIDESDRLLGSYMAGGKFVVAEFERGEVLLRGDGNTKKFLDEMLGLEPSQIKELASHYGVFEVAEKMVEYISQKEAKVANKEELLEIGRSDNEWAKEKMELFLDGSAASKVGSGIYFRHIVPEGFMAVKSEATIGQKRGEILCIGHLSRDFNGFLGALN